MPVNQVLVHNCPQSTLIVKICVPGSHKFFRKSRSMGAILKRLLKDPQAPGMLRYNCKLVENSSKGPV
jgi:hypothetical protein